MTVVGGLAMAGPLEAGRTYALPRTVRVFRAHPLEVQGAAASERARLAAPVALPADLAARVVEVRTDGAGNWYRIEPVTSGTLALSDEGGRAWVSGEQVDGLGLVPAPEVGGARKSAPRATATASPAPRAAAREARPRAGVSGMAGRYGGAATKAGASTPALPLPIPSGGGATKVVEVVYICENGKLYHRDIECPAIRTVEHCNGTMESVSVEKAQAKGRSSCRACGKSGGPQAPPGPPVPR